MNQPNQTAAYTYYAIDVAKKTLQVQTPEAAFSIANTPRGHSQLIRRIRSEDQPVLVVCEASGGYERDLLGALDYAQIARCRFSADRVRAFAKSLGIKTKSDPIDAKVLLQFARKNQPQPNTPDDPAQLELAALVDRRAQLVEMQSVEQTRLQNSSKTTHSSNRRCLEWCADEIARIEADITKHLDKHPHLNQAANAIQTIHGIGPITAWSILAYLPELPEIKRGQAVALAGLAPYRNQSGEKEGRRKLYGGRAKLRKALYMPALCAIRNNDHIRTYYLRRISEGLPKMSAVVAVMRKLLIHIRSILIEHQKALA